MEGARDLGSGAANAPLLERAVAERAARVLGELLGRRPADVPATPALARVVRTGLDEALAAAMEALDNVGLHTTLSRQRAGGARP